MNFLIKILITTVNAFVLQWILPGIKMNDFFTAIWFALLLGVLDAFVKPILVILTLPATIFTLGLFLFAINAFLVLIGDHFIDSMQVDGFWHAVLFSVLLSFFNSIVLKKALPAKETRQ